MRTVALFSIVGVAVLGACGGGDDSAAPGTTAAPIACEVEGLSFTSGLANCDEALARGGAIALDAGRVTRADSPAALSDIAALCHALDGNPTTAERRAIEFANDLLEARVCLGSLANLTRPGTISADTPFTLVDVLAGDTLELAAPDGTVLTVQIAGIDAPEPVTECYGSEAAKMVAFIVGANSVTLSPEAPADDGTAQTAPGATVADTPPAASLRYVTVTTAIGDVFDVGSLMIEQGGAETFRNGPDLAKADEYDDLEAAAKAAGAGKWAPDACADFTPPPTTAVPGSAPTTTA